MDATSIPRELQALRTLFNSFHHFRPNEAHSILEYAYHSRQPIAISETIERTFSKKLLSPLGNFLSGSLAYAKNAAYAGELVATDLCGDASACSDRVGRDGVTLA